ncbi:MAG: exo-alpha-sialidase, partial [Acidobacteria bacterium]|nr:exo-alpha-sialidase [Acidobacteriota bacterium]
MLLHVGTRKGYLALRRFGRGDWRCERTAFIGDPVSQLLPDPRDGKLYAALNLGHFGVKLRVSEDGGASFSELPAPAYGKEEASSEKAPSVDL